MSNKTNNEDLTAMELLMNDYMNICGYSRTDAYYAAKRVLEGENGQVELCL